MVKVAVAGGTGNVATNLLKATIASGRHEITIFTRSDPAKLSSPSPLVSYKKVDYHNRDSLTAALKGFDVCLSFFVVHLDVNCEAQKNLIHASIDAGVRRFAPSEWGIKNNSGCAPYANKDEIARYLAQLKEEGKLAQLEYCLFQPSIFMDYFAHPYPLSPELITWPFFLDFENRRAIVLGDGSYPLVITAIADDSEILLRALEDERPWPNVGGFRGHRTTINELLALGQKIRGGDWTIENVRVEDIEKGVLKTNWVPQLSHPVIPVEDRPVFSEQFVIMFLQGILNGSWDVSDEFNKRYPDYKFISGEEYLTKAWEGKP
ncbi:NmrA-like family protein-like protein [Cucurbitaria berberidis CBS 394.84]|uniref:NmrA-like family protein-like protein n=1 Tax=Cucurbitaria berberidis CBS 394.84 TaxID=1168544 RepID=A0A9P4GQV7_9PLEO|nr:NmrA-like family protein-like protein [Cucurbitaria berberidis CBS 394.84]KAF1849655.1 NmrA-like family protein-like protein [Cucurbitaria berberidis CBS 394.84]